MRYTQSTLAGVRKALIASGLAREHRDLTVSFRNKTGFTGRIVPTGWIVYLPGDMAKWAGLTGPLASFEAWQEATERISRALGYQVIVESAHEGGLCDTLILRLPAGTSC